MFNNIKVTEDNFKVGDKVVRGEDWSWYDQDGGKGGVGTIEYIIDDRWVNVRWLNTDHTNFYRIGVEGCYDLYFYTGEITDSLMHRIGHLLLNK